MERNGYKLIYIKHPEKSPAERGRHELLLFLLRPPLGWTSLSLGPGEDAGWVLGSFAPWPHLLISILFFFFVSLLSRFARSGGWQSRKPHRILFVKNCVDAESIFELVGLCPAHDKMGVWEELGAGS